MRSLGQKGHVMEKGTVYVTDHAYGRIKERMGLSNRAAARMAELAYEDGITYSETSGKLYQYIEGKTQSHLKPGINIKIYGEVVYCFLREKVNKKEKIFLLTAWNIPNDLKKSVLSVKKKRWVNRYVSH